MPDFLTNSQKPACALCGGVCACGARLASSQSRGNRTGNTQAAQSAKMASKSTYMPLGIASLGRMFAPPSLQHD